MDRVRKGLLMAINISGLTIMVNLMVKESISGKMGVFIRVILISTILFTIGYFKGGLRHGYGKWRSSPINGLYDEFDG